FFAIARKDGGADAHADGNERSVHRDRRVENAHDVRLNRIQDACVSQAGGEHSEFISTQSRNLVRWAHGVFQPPRENLQQNVADAVAIAVVDRLKVIQIDVEHAEQESRAPRIFDLVFEFLEKGKAV